jgi:hypothetical protein
MSAADAAVRPLYDESDFQIAKIATLPDAVTQLNLSDVAQATCTGPNRRSNRNVSPMQIRLERARVHQGDRPGRRNRPAAFATEPPASKRLQ